MTTRAERDALRDLLANANRWRDELTGTGYEGASREWVRAQQAYEAALLKIAPSLLDEADEAERWRRHADAMESIATDATESLAKIAEIKAENAALKAERAETNDAIEELRRSIDARRVEFDEVTQENAALRAELELLRELEEPARFHHDFNHDEETPAACPNRTCNALAKLDALRAKGK